MHLEFQVYIRTSNVLLKEKKTAVAVLFFLDWSDDMTNVSSLSVVRIFLLFLLLAIPVSLFSCLGPFFSAGTFLGKLTYHFTSRPATQTSRQWQTHCTCGFSCLYPSSAFVFGSSFWLSVLQEANIGTNNFYSMYILVTL